METEDGMVEVPSVKEESGLYCFIDSARPCSADCMAFLTTLPEAKEFQGNQWAQCHLLVNIHRMGKYSSVTASELYQIRVTAAKASQPVPPRVG